MAAESGGSSARAWTRPALAGARADRVDHSRIVAPAHRVEYVVVDDAERTQGPQIPALRAARVTAPGEPPPALGAR